MDNNSRNEIEKLTPSESILTKLGFTRHFAVDFYYPPEPLCASDYQLKFRPSRYSRLPKNPMWIGDDDSVLLGAYITWGEGQRIRTFATIGELNLFHIGMGGNDLLTNITE